MSEENRNGIYHSATHGDLNLDEVISHIKNFLEEAPEATYSLVIGTDSQEKNSGADGGARLLDKRGADGGARLLDKRGADEKNGNSTGKKKHNGVKDINLVTAVVVYRKGNGGKYFWKRKRISNIHSLRQKIYSETLVSLEFATEFIPYLKKTLNGKMPDYDLEIHVDVGEHGDTREMIKEVVGMVTGNGFVAKTKPYAFGASYVADKHT